MADLVIRINGDVKNYSDALAEAQSKTEDLDGSLKRVAAGSALALAALTAEAYAALHAFAGQEEASNKLARSLQQQGIYTTELSEKYKKYADNLQNLTGIDDDSVVAGMAVMQGMIGQTKITEGLTKAVADLAVGKGMDLTAAFELAGKAINGNAAILQRYGIEVQLGTDRAENMRKVTMALTGAVGGQAEAANQGLGSWRMLSAMFGEVQEGIGKRLAPVAEALISTLTRMFTAIKNNETVLDLLVSFGVAAAGVASLGVAAGTAGAAFLALKAALAAAQIQTTAMTVAVRGLVGATGIGLLLILVTEIYLNWQSVWPRMQAAFSGFVAGTMNLLSGLGSMLKGVFTLDYSLLKQGLAEAKSALSVGMTAYDTTLKTKLDERKKIEEKAEEDKTALNDKGAAAREAKKKAHEQRMLEIEREKRAAMVMQAEMASEEAMNLQRQEIALLEQIDDEKNEKIRGKLQERLSAVRQMQEIQNAQDIERQRMFHAQILAENEEFASLEADEQSRFLQQNAVQLQASIQTEATTRQLAAQEKAKQQIEANNLFLKNQQQYGTAYAFINQMMNSEIYKGNKQAFGELAALQQSSNSTLKSIGKVAAVANIVIRTAESAMNIYAGFSTIPIVGPALGIAGAAAAVAFGAEQVGKVNAAYDGGLVTGGIPGRDSVPFMLAPGELVTPARNFDEVVNAVAASRTGTSPAGDGAGGGTAHVILELKGELMDFIEAKMIERQSLGISLQGV